MDDVGTVTSKSMITIPSRIRKRHGLRQGSKVKFVEIEGRIVMVPLRSLREMRGVAKDHASRILDSVKELEREHREEAARDARNAGP